MNSIGVGCQVKLTAEFGDPKVYTVVRKWNSHGRDGNSFVIMRALDGTSLSAGVQHLIRV